MMKIFRKLHLWLSVPFGLVVVITCLTGALLVFEKEITSLCRSDVADVRPAGEPLPLDMLASKVQPLLPDGVGITGFTIADDNSRAYKVNLTKPRGAALYVNQYTGEVKGSDERLPFFTTVFRLHRWLLDENPGNGKIFWGRLIVGTSTLFFVGILITGIVVWWPRNKKMLKNRVKVVVRKGKNRFWHDLHVAGGFYGFLLLLTMALTGLNWSFEWYRNGVYSLLGAGTAQSSAPRVASATISADAVSSATEQANDVCIGDCSKCVTRPCMSQPQADATGGATEMADAASGATVSADAASGATTVSPVSGNEPSSQYAMWQMALDSVKTRASGYSQITVASGSVTVRRDGFGNQQATDKYVFNNDTGEITSVQMYDEAPRREKVRGWLYTLHVGSWCGWFSRILAFLAALLGATLPLTGYYFWIRRLYGKRKNR